MKNVQEFLILAGQNDELKKRDAITVKSEDHVSVVGRRAAGPLHRLPIFTSL
jgi:hypothetical protein